MPNFYNPAPKEISSVRITIEYDPADPADRVSSKRANAALEAEFASAPTTASHNVMSLRPKRTR